MAMRDNHNMVIIRIENVFTMPPKMVFFLVFNAGVGFKSSLERQNQSYFQFVKLVFYTLRFKLDAKI